VQKVKNTLRFEYAIDFLSILTISNEKTQN
jgi:hypothetical protein